MKSKKIIYSLLNIFIFIFPSFSLDLFVTVIDRDLSIPLEGVIIQVENKEYFVNEDGIAILSFPDDVSRAVIIAKLIGYESRKQLVTDFSKPISISMLMEGVFVGEELVVEAEAIGETDSEVGVSAVIEEEFIHSVSKIGLVEDALNAVRILPGVTYSSGFGAFMSVRGEGYTGISAVMDGFETMYPYHLGGYYSIFNPNIVESIKFSPGIFSVKNGSATSALMEVKTIDPTDGLKLHVIGSSSTNEAFFQVPIGQKNKLGVLGGFRLTFWEPGLRALQLYGESSDSSSGAAALSDMIDEITIFPHIYDFYFKSVYKPSKVFKWYINGFSGKDGMALESLEDDVDKSKEMGMTQNSSFINNDYILTTGIDLLINEHLLLNSMVGYESLSVKDKDSAVMEGTHFYTDEFRFQNDIIDESVYFSNDIYRNKNIFTTDVFQSRLDLDWSINDKIIIQGGLGASNKFYNIKSENKEIELTYSGAENLEYDDFMDSEETYDLESSNLFNSEGKIEPSFLYNTNKSNVNTFSSFSYLNLNTDIISDFLSMELGCRADYFYGANIELAPRIRLSITPEFNNSILTKNEFTIGSGLFNKSPLSSLIMLDFPLDKTSEVKLEKSFMNLIGWQTSLPYDLRFKIEGYYKYLYDRTYANNWTDENNNINYNIYTNGYGYAIGGDLLLEKKISRYIDGMLSYTYVHSKYKNPTSDVNQNISRYPRGKYYWPDFHRFHNMNLLLNIKPRNGFSITTLLGIASGAPKRDKEFSLKASSGNTDLYDIDSLYSDTKRTEFSFPLDVKFTWHNYLQDSKVEWEFYIAIENVLFPILKMNKSMDEVSGDIYLTEDGNINWKEFIMPSIGFRLDF